ncbi:hypothetical protein BH582_10885 [Vibrio sp. 10N.222.47.A9]|uniref:HNH endonuclease n=1 Tax=Vibrio sp. 10N.222.47.A9 TaxID=1903178 RepID=UPI00097673C8|nr:HNH endonuclease [Vibrio sp. 10N.222.47.A9]OMO32248.1 hypothetical protein BH582_10885 [Vibrio sp. 10N.222.47.A9]
MVDKIAIPYKLSLDDLKNIKSYFNDHNDWGNDKFNDFKASVIEHLRIQQNNNCCYCKWKLGYDIKNVDIEHIIPKSKYSEFTFNPKNLALSCPGCNTSKSSNNVLHKPIKRYPRSGSNIMIIHPHFDDYEQCIEIHDGAIYEAIDDDGKGCDTIKICKLHRMKKVLKNMKKSNAEQSPIKNLVENLRSATQEDQQEFMNLLGELTNNFQGNVGD